MSKLLNSVLEKISENNNDYRKELSKLNSIIEEKTTSLVGELVTISNYTLDFSSTVESAMEKVVNPINNTVEAYIIKDLRSVESVNEQFFEKINDKIETSEITNDAEKEAFIESLDNLLNDKYLEIVKIKRKPFLNETGINDDIEESINSFVNQLNIENASDVVERYKTDIYEHITDTLSLISSLYQNNFVTEISAGLASAVDYNKDMDEEPKVQEEEKEDYKPFEPEMLNIASVPALEEIQPHNSIEETNLDKAIEDKIKDAEDTTINVDKPLLVIDEERLPQLEEFVPPVLPSVRKKQEKIAETKEKEVEVKKAYDVDEILKIAKSPVVSDISDLDSPSNDTYKEVKPIEIAAESNIDTNIDEKGLVEEMIRRLSKRLEEINVKESEIKEEEDNIIEDEKFVNDLIDSSNSKIEELNEFEKELDKKEEELNEKQKELDKKINDIMPFADAVMKSEKES